MPVLSSEEGLCAPLIRGHALTISKSMGATIPHVTMHFGDMPALVCGYVAMRRVKNRTKMLIMGYPSKRFFQTVPTFFLSKNLSLEIKETSLSCLEHCARHMFLRRPHKSSSTQIGQASLFSCVSETVGHEVSGFAQQTTANHSDKQQRDKQRESKRHLASGLASAYLGIASERRDERGCQTPNPDDDVLR